MWMISNLLFYLFSFIPDIKHADYFFFLVFKGDEKGSYRGSRILKVVIIVFVSGAYSILLFSFLSCTWGESSSQISVLPLLSP